ncbi:hypothetical protein JHK87_033704 [Glycine soja]|nr:hypothetical protein JHK87_033704 [Glycine soja]
MCEYGKPSTQCGFCKAELWFQERATISTTNNTYTQEHEGAAVDHKQIKGDHNNTHKFVMHPLKHIDNILRRAPKSTFSTIYFADEVMEDKGCED